MTEATALLEEPKRVMIAGQDYEVQPLGLLAQAPLARMLMIATERGKLKVSDLLVTADDGSLAEDAAGNVQLNGEGIGKFLLVALGYCEAEVFALLSQLLGVNETDLRDPKRFPLTAMPAAIAALASSIDFTAFLADGVADNSNQKRAGHTSPSDGSSISSNTGTGGPTTS